MEINLTPYKERLKLQKNDGQVYVFDPIRKKYLVLQPEELVRQLLYHFMVDELKYPSSNIKFEFTIEVNTLRKRCDVLVYDKDYQPKLIIECKSPKIKLKQATFEQAATYNLKLQVDYLIITNGLEAHAAFIDFEKKDSQLLDYLPTWADLNGGKE